MSQKINDRVMTGFGGSFVSGGRVRRSIRRREVPEPMIERRQAADDEQKDPGQRADRASLADGEN